MFSIVRRGLTFSSLSLQQCAGEFARTLAPKSYERWCNEHFEVIKTSGMRLGLLPVIRMLLEAVETITYTVTASEGATHQEILNDMVLTGSVPDGTIVLSGDGKRFKQGLNLKFYYSNSFDLHFVGGVQVNFPGAVLSMPPTGWASRAGGHLEQMRIRLADHGVAYYGPRYLMTGDSPLLKYMRMIMNDASHELEQTPADLLMNIDMSKHARCEALLVDSKQGTALIAGMMTLAIKTGTGKDEYVMVATNNCTYSRAMSE